MKKNTIIKILLCIAAAVCLGLFFIRITAGANIITAGLWIAVCVIILIIALAIKVNEEKAVPSIIGSAVTLALSLMVFFFFIGRSMSPEHTAQLPEPTEAAATDAVNTASPTAVITSEPISTASITPIPTPEADAVVQDWYYSGMYRVGIDIPAGEYNLIPDNYALAYYEIASNSEGNTDSIIANESTYDHRFITVFEGEYLKIQNCKICPMVKYISLTGLTLQVGMKTTFNNGMWKVGVDIPAGEYNVIMIEDASTAYVEITSDSRHTLESILYNENFSGNIYITLHEGEYVTLHDCVITIPAR